MSNLKKCFKLRDLSTINRRQW